MRGGEPNAGYWPGPGRPGATVVSAATSATLALALFQCVASAGQVLVNADQAYSEGVTGGRVGTVEPIYSAHVRNDTVVLSVGYSFEAALYPVLIPDGGGFWGAVMATDTLHTRSGFRASPSLRSAGGPPCCYGHSTLGNTDTVWEQATAFPDSLAALDSIDETGYWRPTSGKWCFGFGPPDYSYHYLADWNAVFYIECPGPRYLKLQVARQSSDTVFVRWAVDSAGNGLFRTAPVAVKRAGVYRAGTLARPGDGQVFDLRGGLLSSGRRSGAVVRTDAVGGRGVVEVLVGERRAP